jgi:16S rRNA (guanine966-N2)-methyltransferase
MPIRPTPDALRERAFAVLGGRVSGARVLDLFSGTGAVGLEALSRGAASVVFVERRHGGGRLIRANLDALEVPRDTGRLLLKPVRAALRDLERRGDSFDLVWADPPFETWQQGAEAIVAVGRGQLLREAATVCLECPSGAEVVAPSGFELERDLRGGASRLVILTWTG